MKSIVGNPTVVLEQAGGRYLYLSGEGAVVMTREGQVVTAYTVRDFLPHVWQVLKTVGRQ